MDSGAGLAYLDGMQSAAKPSSVSFNRRSFLKLTGAAALSLSVPGSMKVIAGPFEPSDTADHFVPADKKLHGEWIQALFAKGEPVWYLGEDLSHIGMPVGGICAGQLYLAGDGRLTHWDIFNDSHEDARSGTHYQVVPPQVGEVQQGFALRVRTKQQTVTRTLDRAGFPDVRFRGEYPIGLVDYADPDCPVGVTLEAFSPFIPLNAADSALPVTVLNFTLKNNAATTAEIVLAGRLENAVCCRSGNYVEGRRRNRFVRSKNLSALAGSAQAMAKPARPERPPIVLTDFEQPNYGEWKIAGEAFGAKPASGTLPNQQHVSGFLGRGLVNSFLNGDQSQGKLTSPVFKIERPFINFLLGGGSHVGRTCINLLVDGKQVRTAAGRDREQLAWQSWNVKEFAGRQARIEIVDRETGPWGHINIDQVELSDAPRRGQEGPLETQPDFGTMTLGVLGKSTGVVVLPELPGDSLAAWLDGASKPAGCETAEQPFDRPLIGALCKTLRLKPGEQTQVTFIVSWHFANLPQHGNHYGKRFSDALAVSRYVAENFDRLAEQTRLWRDTWYDASLPSWLLDRLFAPVSILASSTCQWWGNGRFWAWEGVRCCAGTCAHVWNYEHALARLFPELERSVRELQDFGPGLQPTGAVLFRGESNDMWAGDSQGGTALKCLREHQCSADASFLKRNWPSIRKTVEFLMKQDGNDDGLIEGLQHNTYDINFFGANTMVGSLYLGALRAAEEMAREVGDNEFASRCHALFEAGRRHTVEQLFNGEYFIQRVDLKQHPDHQYATGCLADQLFGQGWAHQVGLGYLYPREKVLSALRAIYVYNWAPDIGPQNEAHPPQRWFARPGEAGLFTCTWPKSQHLGPQSVLYRDEIWTGIEYQVAGHMAWEGMLTEALAICRGVHERHHPSKHNPWNEVECGDHYARAMASHGVFLGLCGFESHGPQGHLGFAPRFQPEKFQAAFTGAEGWGTLGQTIGAGQQAATVQVKWGKLRLRTLALQVPEKARVGTTSVRVAGKPVPASATQEGRRVLVTLEREIWLDSKTPLEAHLSLG